MIGILKLGPGKDFFFFKYTYCSYANNPTMAEQKIAVVDTLG